MIKHWRKDGERCLKQNWEKRLTRERQWHPRGTSVLGHKSSSYLGEIFFKEQFWIFLLLFGVFFPHWPSCRVPQNFTTRIFSPLKYTGPNHTTRPWIAYPCRRRSATRHYNDSSSPVTRSPLESSSSGGGLLCRAAVLTPGGCAAGPAGKARQAPRTLLDSQPGCWGVTSELTAGRN